MATLTVKNIPDEIYRKLKERAEQHRRSLNSEIIVCLEQTLGPAAVRVEEALAVARRVRSRIGGPPLTARELR